MASLQGVDGVTAEIARVNLKLEDLEEKIDGQLSQPQSSQSSIIMERLMKREEALLREKEQLLKLRQDLVAHLPESGKGPEREKNPKSSQSYTAATTEEAVEQEKEEEEKEEEGEQETDQAAAGVGLEGGTITLMDDCHHHPLTCYIQSGPTAALCNASCYMDINQGTLFYTCLECGICKHDSCLTADPRFPLQLTDARHPHPLVLKSKSDAAPFYTCSACGLTGLTWVYECKAKGCQVSVHPRCISVETTLHDFGHWLCIDYLSPGPCSAPGCPSPSEGRAGLSCEHRFWKASGILKEESCGATFHLSCIRNKMAPFSEERIAVIDAARKRWKESGQVQGIETRDSGVYGDTIVLKDWSHPHPLKCYVSDGNYTCDICRAIVNPHALFFACLVCDFGVHDSCLTADLLFPLQLTDARHPHPLSLKPRSTSTDKNGHYECFACNETGRTWLYECTAENCTIRAHPSCLRVETTCQPPGHWLLIDSFDEATCRAPVCSHRTSKPLRAGLGCELNVWKLMGTLDKEVCEVKEIYHPECISDKLVPFSQDRVEGLQSLRQKWKENKRVDVYFENVGRQHGTYALQDPLHPHQLVGVEWDSSLESPHTCNVCKGTTDDTKCLMFVCIPCNWFAHLSCLTADLTLPPELTDARHPHPLTLKPKSKGGDALGYYECAVCDTVGRTWVYECDTRGCDHKVHPNCLRVDSKAHTGLGHWLGLTYHDPCSLPNCPRPNSLEGASLRCRIEDWSEKGSCDLVVHPSCVSDEVTPFSAERVAKAEAVMTKGRQEIRAKRERETEDKRLHEETMLKLKMNQHFVNMQNSQLLMLSAIKNI